jgi:hypothetical protein
MSLVWHQIKERPLVDLDINCFVLCLGDQGWSCGKVLLDGHREGPRYERKTRPVTDADKGKFIVGKDPSGWHCGIIGDNFGPVIRQQKVSVIGAISAHAVTIYKLIDPSELPQRV